MNETQCREAIRYRLERLRTLRDEIRLDLHLAGMEARTRWEDLEPMARDAELLSHAANEMARETLEAAVERLSAFQDTLRYGKHPQQPHPPG